MALRAVSIVNMESTIRAQFDQRINEIRRSIQLDYQDRSSGVEGQGTGENSNDNHSNNVVTNDIESGEIVSRNPNREDNTDGGDINANEPNQATETSDDMNEQGDLGVPRIPGSRATSWDIRVEYDEFPDGQRQSEVDLSSETSDTLSREIHNLSDPEDRNLSCCAFYRKHWVGHLITGMLTGFLFIILGVVFLVNGNEFPFYAGITLIVLGVAPCCMALNRYRYARLYDQERRRALQRLNALRRAHRRHVREERMRQRPRYSDQPPSYDNLGFEDNEEDLELDELSLATTAGSFVLPTYEQFMEKKREKLEKRQEKGVKQENEEYQEQAHPEDQESVPPPSYNENNNNNYTNAAFDQEERQFVQISMVDDQIEIIEMEQEHEAAREEDHSPNTVNNNDPNSSMTPSSGSPQCNPLSSSSIVMDDGETSDA